MSQAAQHSPKRLLLPAPRLLYLLLLWVLLGGIWQLWLQPDWAMPVWQSMGGALLLLAGLDAWLCWREPNTLQISHQGPERWPQNAPVKLGTRLRHTGRRALRVELYELYPNSVSVEGMPRQLVLQGGQEARLQWQARGHLRGPVELPGQHLLHDSRLGLWRRRLTIQQPRQVRVYPNFNRVAQHGILAGDQALRWLGMHTLKNRGTGTDFHQLRDYVEGDSLRQIDAAASARMRRPISREYQEERNQRVVFLLDASRRMRTHRGDMTHFDHALDATLLLSHVALNQGDEVGLHRLEDGQDQPLHVPPGRGQRHYGELLEAIHDQQPAASHPDFLSSAAQLMRHHRRRSLVILLTNLRDEDHEELLNAARLLRQRHLLIIANLAEVGDDSAHSLEIDTLDQALLAAANTLYREQRKRHSRQMQQHGVIHIDTTPERLPAVLVAQYRRLKARGML